MDKVKISDIESTMWTNVIEKLNEIVDVINRIDEQTERLQNGVQGLKDRE